DVVQLGGPFDGRTHGAAPQPSSAFQLPEQLGLFPGRVGDSAGLVVDVLIGHQPATTARAVRLVERAPGRHATGLRPAPHPAALGRGRDGCAASRANARAVLRTLAHQSPSSSQGSAGSRSPCSQKYRAARSTTSTSLHTYIAESANPWSLVQT